MPSSRDVIKVHNAELYVEAMQSADWSLSEAERRAREESEKAVQQNKQSTASPSTSAPNSGKFAPSTSDALAGKRAVLEADFRAKMDIAKRESDRRSHEKMLRQEKQFEERYASFMAKNREIVAASKMHEEASLVKERKRERLYQDWMQKVFLPMQNEINTKIESANTEDIIAFRNQQYQAYLDECNRTQKNGGGIHRDVVVETQYNPFVVNRAATVKYATVGLAEDPLKNRITRESQLPGGSNAPPTTSSSPTSPHTSSSLVASVLSSSQLPKRSTYGATLESEVHPQNSSTADKPAGAGGGASLSARFGVKHGSYAQSHAHASKFQLFPSEALGTASGRDVEFNNSDFLSTRGGGDSPRPPRLLPAVGGTVSSNASRGLTHHANGASALASLSTSFKQSGSTLIPHPLPSATSMTRIIATNADPKYKYSANTSLFNQAVEPIPVRSTLVDVKQWARMDATPHGRYSDDNIGPTGKPRVRPPGYKAEMERPTKVVFDHYNMPRGEEGVRQVKAELTGTGKGKKCDYDDKSTPNPLS